MEFNIWDDGWMGGIWQRIWSSSSSSNAAVKQKPAMPITKRQHVKNTRRKAHKMPSTSRHGIT